MTFSRQTIIIRKGWESTEHISMLGDLVPESHNKHNVFRCIILQKCLLLQTILPCIIPLANFFAMWIISFFMHITVYL